MNIRPVTLGVSLLTIVSIIAIVLLRVLVPTDTVTVGLILAFVVPTVASLLVLGKVQEVHVLFNSKMDEALRVNRMQALAEGHLQGMADERAQGLALDAAKASGKVEAKADAKE